MRHLKPILTILAMGLLAIGFQNCGQTQFGQAESKSVGVQAPPPDAETPPFPHSSSESDGGSCVDNNSFAKTMYRCDTKRGSIYFRYCRSELKIMIHAYHPVGTGTFYSPSTTECTNSSLPVGPGRASCLFYNNPEGRWSLYIETNELPQTLRAQIANNYDCDNYALQPGVTPAECKAQYDCHRVQ